MWGGGSLIHSLVGRLFKLVIHARATVKMARLHPFTPSWKRKRATVCAPLFPPASPVTSLLLISAHRAVVTFASDGLTNCKHSEDGQAGVITAGGRNLMRISN